MSYSKKEISVNLNALLDTLAWSEGTTTHPLTIDDGYDVIVSGVNNALEVFTNYTLHPFTYRKPKQINNKGLYSSASGRYQFMLVHYQHYRKLLNLDQYGLAFGPKAQDKWAIQLIKEFKGLPLIEDGKFEQAIVKIAPLWASLPGKGYVNQSQHSMSKLKAVYISKGGLLWTESTALSPPSLELLPLALESTLKENEPGKLKQSENPKLSLLQKVMQIFKKKPTP